MKKRKNFLLQIFTIVLIAIVSFGAGKISKRSDNIKHYLNWYFIGLYNSLNKNKSMDDEILELLHENPSVEEEKRFLEEMIENILGAPSL